MDDQDEEEKKLSGEEWWSEEEEVVGEEEAGEASIRRRSFDSAELSFEDADSDERLSEIFEGLADEEDLQAGSSEGEGDEIESEVMREALEMSREVSLESADSWESELVAAAARKEETRGEVCRPKRSDWKRSDGTTSFLEEMVVHCGHVARQGLRSIEDLYEKSFAALHMLYILASEAPLSCFLTTEGKGEPTKVLRTVVSVAYRCSSMRLPSALNDSPLPKDWNYLLDLTELQLGSQRLQNLLDQLAAQPVNSKIYSVRRLAAKLLDVVSARLCDDNEKIYNSILSECRQEITKRRLDLASHKAIVQADSGKKRNRSHKKQRASSSCNRGHGRGRSSH